MDDKTRYVVQNREETEAGKGPTECSRGLIYREPPSVVPDDAGSQLKVRIDAGRSRGPVGVGSTPWPRTGRERPPSQALALLRRGKLTRSSYSEDVRTSDQEVGRRVGGRTVGCKVEKEGSRESGDNRVAVGAAILDESGWLGREEAELVTGKLDGVVTDCRNFHLRQGLFNACSRLLI